MKNIATDLREPLIELLLSIADDKFVLGHRIADWTGLGPILEEDIAFSSIAQDELAHALVLYEQIGQLTGQPADQVAYGRKTHEYRCAAIVEIADDLNWDLAIARQFYCDHFDLRRLGRLAKSSNAHLAALASRLAAEERVHVEHVDHWIVQLGQAGVEARQRTESALNKFAAAAAMLFEPTDGVARLESAGIYPRGERDPFELWRDDLLGVCAAAGLSLKLVSPDPQTVGGRRGRHDAAFGELLAELTEVYHIEPQAKW